MPSIDELLWGSWIRAEAVSEQEIAVALERAHEEVAAAQQLFDEFPSPAYELAYNAMLLAVTALIYADGYRARVERHHKTLAEYAEAKLATAHSDLAAEFERARRKRHRTIYGQVKATQREAGYLVKKAEQMIEVAEHLLAENQADGG
jgi:uncharacterized protein (UPF0332 family)